MDTLKGKLWLLEHDDVWVEVLRVFAGIVLVLKGIFFVGYMRGLNDLVLASEIPFASALIAHYVVLAHVVGGVFLLAGFVTRISAAVQIPILLGAIFYVNRGAGLSADLILAIAVLVSLVIVTYKGPGRWTLDAYFSRRYQEAIREDAGEPITGPSAG